LHCISLISRTLVIKFDFISHMQRLAGRSVDFLQRVLESTRYVIHRLTPLLFVSLLLDFIFCATCVAIPYYLVGTKHALLYYQIYPALLITLINALYHCFRLFSSRKCDASLRTHNGIGQIDSEHCQLCGLRVSGLYDHCSWLGVCISARNARHFFLLLIHLLIYSITSAAVTVPLAVQLIWEPSLLYRICYKSHLGPLSLFFCQSWSSSQSFMLFYLMSAAAALAVAVSLVPVLLLFTRFTVYGGSFSRPSKGSLIYLIDQNFLCNFLLQPGERLCLQKLLKMVLIPSRQPAFW
ncbi:hypothetical protein PFISCL1PPCAC_8649, partial [Pristionchus fissidentatus]